MDKIIDDPLEHDRLLGKDLYLGKAFPPAMRASGYVFVMFGIYQLFHNPLVGIGLMLPGLYMILATIRIQVDVDKGRYRECTGIFGLKVGRWKSYENYPDIAILREKLVTAAFGMRSNRRTVTSEDLFYDIYLLDDTHREKILLRRMRDKEQAARDAELLAGLMKKNFTGYHPQISARTRARRR